MKIRIGTRGSLLATTQTNLVADALRTHSNEMEIEVVTYVTSGDKKQTQAYDTPRDKKEWIIELERALIEKEIDLAVHSSKDVPIDIEPDTLILPILHREDPRDVIVLSESGQKKMAGQRLAKLQVPLNIATASLRRQNQLMHINPNVNCHPIRGNITTRIEKLKEAQGLDGVVLAVAGIQRLGLSPDNLYFLNTDEMVPAVNQGSLLGQIRENDSQLTELLSSISDDGNAACWKAERIVIEALDADCRSSLGVYAWVKEQQIFMKSRVLGKGKVIENSSHAKLDDSSEMAKQHAQTLLARGASELV